MNKKELKDLKKKLSGIGLGDAEIVIIKSKKSRKRKERRDKR